MTKAVWGGRGWLELISYGPSWRENMKADTRQKLWKSSTTAYCLACFPCLLSLLSYSTQSLDELLNKMPVRRETTSQSDGDIFSKEVPSSLKQKHNNRKQVSQQPTPLLSPSAGNISIQRNWLIGFRNTFQFLESLSIYQSSDYAPSRQDLSVPASSVSKNC